MDKIDLYYKTNTVNFRKDFEEAKRRLGEKAKRIQHHHPASKWWGLTIYDEPPGNFRQCIETMTKLAQTTELTRANWADERCPVTGRAHMQTVLAFKEITTLTTVMTHFPNVHLGQHIKDTYAYYYFYLNYSVYVLDPLEYSNLNVFVPLDRTGKLLCPTDWLFDPSGPDATGLTSQQYFTGDGCIGNKATLKYMHLGVQLRSINPYDTLTTINNTRFPIWPVRVIVLMGKGGAFFQSTDFNGGTNLPFSDREGGYANALNLSEAWFGYETGGFTGTVGSGLFVACPTPTTAPLDRDMGSKSKQFHVLLDTIIDVNDSNAPNTVGSGEPLVIGSTCCGGVYSRVFKIPIDKNVSWEGNRTGSSLFPNLFNGAVGGTGNRIEYDDGCLQVLIVNDFDPSATSPANMENVQVNVTGYISYTDV